MTFEVLGTEHLGQSTLHRCDACGQRRRGVVALVGAKVGTGTAGGTTTVAVGRCPMMCQLCLDDGDGATLARLMGMAGA